MVALALQQCLMDEIAELTKDMRFRTPEGEKTGLNMFRQNLPRRLIKTEETEETEETEADLYGDFGRDEELDGYFPYCVVRLDSGLSESPESALLISTVIKVGTYDDSPDVDGYRSILNIFEDIRARFRKNPILKDMYIAGNEMAWALSREDEESYPYHFGSMYMEWKAPEIRREDPYS